MTCLKKPLYAVGILFLGAMVGLVSAKLSLSLLLSLCIILLILALAASWNCSIGMLLFFSTFNRFSVQLAGSAIRPDMFICFLAVGSFLFQLYRRESDRSRRRLINLNFETVMFTLFISYTFVISIMYSKVYEDSKAGVLQLCFGFLAFIVISQMKRVNLDDIYKFIRYFMAVGIFQATYSLVCLIYYNITGQFLFGEKFGGLMSGQTLSSVTMRGTLFEANLFASYVGTCMLILIALLLNKQLKPSFYTISGLIILAVALLFGWTRSAWIGFAIGMVFLSFIFPKVILSVKTIYLTLTSLLLLSPLFLYLSAKFDSLSGKSGLLVSKFENIFNSEEGTGKIRVDVYHFAMQDWRKNPIFGRGYFSLKQYGDDLWIGNTVISVLHDSGVIGLALFVILFIPLFLKVILNLFAAESIKDKAYLAGMMSGFILTLFSNNFSPNHTLAIFWVELGLLYVMNELATKHRLGISTNRIRESVPNEKKNKNKAASTVRQWDRRLDADAKAGQSDDLQLVRNRHPKQPDLT